MKVLHIAPNYPYSKLYHQLISSLEEKGISDLVYVQSKEPEIERNYPVYYLGRNFGLIDRLLYFRKQSIILNDILHRHIVDGVDVIHAHNLFSAGYCAYKIKKKLGIPYIVAVRNSDVYDFFRYMKHLKFIGVKIMREASAVVFISPSYIDYVISMYVPNRYQKGILDKCYAIPNGLDQYFLVNKMNHPRKLNSPSKISLLYVGDVDRNKNILTTIKACEKLRNKGYDLTYTIVGRIKDEVLKKDIDKDYIRYFSYSPKEKVLELMRKSDIFVMPSIHETFGLVFIEAMSQGLPIVYTKGQGIDGYFKQGEVGFAVDCLDDSAISESIEKITSDFTNISNNCRNSISNFHWPNIAERYIHLYMSACTTL